MIDKKLGKNSLEFQMFNEFWNIFKAYNDIQENDEYWEEVTRETNSFSERYKTTEYEKFAINLSLALVELLDDKAKKNEK